MDQRRLACQPKLTPRNAVRERRLVRPARLERATSWFVARRSIQLSYGRGVFCGGGSGPPCCPPEAVGEDTNIDYNMRLAGPAATFAHCALRRPGKPDATYW